MHALDVGTGTVTAVAELVVIFPTNVWEYDVLDYFPFATPQAKALAEEATRAMAQPGGE